MYIAPKQKEKIKRLERVEELMEEYEVERTDLVKNVLTWDDARVSRLLSGEDTITKRTAEILCEIFFDDVMPEWILSGTNPKYFKDSEKVETQQFLENCNKKILLNELEKNGYLEKDNSPNTKNKYMTTRQRREQEKKRLEEYNRNYEQCSSYIAHLSTLGYSIVCSMSLFDDLCKQKNESSDNSQDMVTILKTNQDDGKFNPEVVKKISNENFLNIYKNADSGFSIMLNS